MALIKKITLPNAAGSGNVEATFNASKLSAGSAYSEDGVLYSEGLKVVTASENGKIPQSLLPSYVDDVVEGYLPTNSLDEFYKDSAYTQKIAGTSGKIYVDLNSNKTYRWSGTRFVVISETLAIGATSSTASRGNHKHTISSTFSGSGSFTGTEGNLIVSGEPLGSVTVAVETTNNEGTKYTPEGTITVPALNVEGDVTGEFTGDSITLESSFTGQSTTSSGMFTPRGTVSQPIFEGTESTIVVNNSSTGEHSHKFTADSSASVPLSNYLKGVDDHAAEDIAKTLEGQFTGESLTSSGTFTPDGTISNSYENTVTSSSTYSKTIKQFTGGGSFTGSVSSGVLTLTHSAATGADVDIGHTHTYDKLTSVTSKFTGTKGNLSVSGTPTGSVEITASTEQTTLTHGTTKGSDYKYTPTGEIDSTKISISASATYIPEGTVSQPNFVGSQDTVSVSGTPQGTSKLKLGSATAAKSITITPTGSVEITKDLKTGTKTISLDGKEVYFKPTFTGSSTTFRGTFTPSGSITVSGSSTHSCSEPI